MKILNRLKQPEFGAALMLGLLAAIEIGQLGAQVYEQGARTLLASSYSGWMLVSVLVAGTITFRLLRYPMASRDLRRNFIVVLVHALACWRFLSIELAVLATLPVFALAAAWWLKTESSAGNSAGD